MRAEWKYQRSLLMGSTSLVIALALSQTAFAEKANPTNDELAQVTQTADQAAQGTADQANAVEEEDQVLVVTGFRAAVQSSIAAKRTSDIIVDVVSSEDIGRLPDVSIAEAIARLPGVTSQRTGGQSSAINIRGLSQDLVSSTLNGREQVATSGLRVIEFEQYPSELISEAQVYKSLKASQIEGGIAGKVELKTVRPLETGKRVFNINVRGSYNDRADEILDTGALGYRLSASYQDQFFNDRVGFALGYSRLVQPNVATRFAGFDFQPGRNLIEAIPARPATSTTPAIPAVPAVPVLDFDNNGRADAVPFGFENVQFGGQETRDAIVTVIQFEPTSNFHILLDGFFSRFNSDRFRRGTRLFGTENVQNFSPGTLTRTGLAFLSNPVTVDNALVGGTFRSGNGIGVENVNQDEGNLDQLYAVGGNFAWDVSERLTLSSDVSFSHADRFFNNSGVTTRAGTIGAGGAFVPANFSASFVRNGLNPATQSINFDFTNPLTNPIQGFFIVPTSDQDELFAVTGDAKYKVGGGFFSSFEAGFRYADRTAQRRVFSFSGSGPTFGSFGLNNPQIVPEQFRTIGSFGGQFGAAGAPNYTAIDIDGVLDFFVGPDRDINQNFGFTRDQSFTIFERILSGYAQANFDTQLGNVGLRGNIGLRVVNTNQGSAATNSVTGFVGERYTLLLPSANFIFNLTNNDVIRLSGSRQISRSRFIELRGSIAVNRISPAGAVSGNGGNPFLRPYLADQGEIIYEHYFGKDGIIALGFFHKSLESFIFGGLIPNFNFLAAGLNLPPTPPSTPGSPIEAPSQPSGPFSAPINGQGGYVRGFEANITQQLTFLPAPLDGLGVVLNYSYVSSSINLPPSTLSGNPINIPLPGQSRHVANPTIYYALNGFETRLGFRYRSGFVAPQFGLNEQITGFDAETVVDWQASYEFGEHSPLKGVRLLFQANNLTDSPNQSFFGVPAQTGTVQRFGRQFYWGASYTF